MYYLIFSIVFLITVSSSIAHAQDIANIEVEQREDQIIITYDLMSSENEIFIRAYASADNGKKYDISISDATGDINRTVTPGRKKEILWNAKNELGVFKGDLKFRLIGYPSTPLARSENSDFIVVITDLRKYNKTRYVINFSIFAKRNIGTMISDKTFMLDNFGNSYKVTSVLLNAKTAKATQFFEQHEEYSGELALDLLKLNPQYKSGTPSEFQLRFFYGNNGVLPFESIPNRD